MQFTAHISKRAAVAPATGRRWEDGAKMVGLRRLLMPAAIGAFAFGQSLITTIDTAQAQAGAAVTKSEEELIKRNFDQCMKDWDASTHMTKRDWERVCRRVATDRGKFRKQQEQEQQQPRTKAK